MTVKRRIIPSIYHVYQMSNTTQLELLSRTFASYINQFEYSVTIFL